MKGLEFFLNESHFKSDLCCVRCFMPVTQVPGRVLGSSRWYGILPEVRECLNSLEY